MAEAQPNTARQRVRVLARELREKAAASGSVHVPDERDRLKAALKADSAFLDRLLDELLDDALYEEMRRVCAETRHEVIVFGDELVTRHELHERMERGKPRWLHRLEHVGDRQIPFGRMLREHHFAAAAERLKRINTEGRIVAVHQAVGRRLPEGKETAECFTDEQIEMIARQQVVELKITERRQPDGTR